MRENIKEQLNDSQYEAVTSIEGPANNNKVLRTYSHFFGPQNSFTIYDEADATLYLPSCKGCLMAP